MAYALQHGEEQDRFGSGIAGAVVLHVVVLALVVAAAWWGRSKGLKYGDTQSSAGAIQASMVSAIPLPHEAPPVPKQVLAPDVTSPAPVVPKEETHTAPKPTDIEVKARTPEKAKIAPKDTPAPPKHAQPTPDIPTKAQTGQVATQLMTSTVQVGNGSSTITVLDRTLGSRYAYYFGIVNRKIAQNWFKAEADPRASSGRQVTLLFDVDRDGTPTNVRVENHSGSITLDQSAVRALQRIDTFGPSPAPGSVTVRDTFVFDTP